MNLTKMATRRSPKRTANRRKKANHQKLDNKPTTMGEIWIARRTR